VLSALASARRVTSEPIPARAGIGLRFPHHRQFLQERPEVPWVEVHTENFMGGGTLPRVLDAVRRHCPVSLHGVGLSLGSAEGLDPAHLRRLRDAVHRFEPALVSEHLSWSVAEGTYLADLLPLPLTEEALDVVCVHVDQAQQALQRRILIENPSSYVRFTHSTVPEWEFLAAVVARTGCGLLCDVNNIYVSAWNHGWDAAQYLSALPASAVGEIHLAGHSLHRLPSGASVRLDDHGSRVSPEVWALYAQALARFGPVPTLIEWDTNLPTLDVLLREAERAQAWLGGIRAEAVHAHAS
jgi:uncharacterized protein